MLISPAFAQASSSTGADLSFPLMMLVLLGIFYFLVLRPQSKRAEEQRAKLSAVRRGDTVVTSGGMVGRVTKVSDTSDEIEVELADNLKVRVVKSTLLDVRAKGEPVKESA
ncbi:MAG: preprotein translocase subunit YajC [Hyphomicrobium sp.]|nr:preprotein translocase subunit YajC [Hyphomicrobiaceae bacterium]